MKNRERWKPTKFIYRKGKLTASRDPDQVSIASRLIADITAKNYDLFLKKHAHGKLLDLGCGEVPLFEAYKDHVKENICVDWENSFHNNEFLDFSCDLTQNLIFKDEEFNTIILSDVLEHIPEPQRLWSEMARILSSDGTVIMNVPFFYSIHEHPHDYYRYTEYALRRFVDLSGLEIETLIPIGGSPEVLADILAKNILPIPIIGSSLAKLTQWATSVFIKTKIGKKVSLLTAKRFPLGYFMIAKKPAAQ